MASLRKRSTLHVPITLSVILMTLNITLMVFWIVLLARLYWWGALTIGTVAFALVLLGLSYWMFLTIKEIRLNQRQANFVDSVTHELKSPIASLKLYLETLQMRSLDERQRDEFYGIMGRELFRLDHLINQLLEVGRIDALGEQAEPEDVAMEPLLRNCAQTACAVHKRRDPGEIMLKIEPSVVHARRMLLEIIFSNLLDNALKYSSDPPEVEVEVQVRGRGRVVARVSDNGPGVPQELRKKIFGIFYRGGSELERRTTGTGLGLYIVHTLVKKLNGRISVHSRPDGTGSVFEVELPGRAEPCAS